MTIADAMAMELEQESISTRKLLERLPADTFGWKPHEKSMPLGQLASHIVAGLKWMDATINLKVLELDPTTYTELQAKNAEELVAEFDKNLAAALETLRGTSDEAMMENWQLKVGDAVVFEAPRAGVVRGFIISHQIHHRGQLSVYARIQDVPIPSIYGPSADEQN